MMPKLTRCIALALAPLALALCPSCSGTADEPAPVPQSATLAIRVEPLGIAGKAAGDASLPDNEKMHSIRVIVVRPDGSVEQNRHIALQDPRLQQRILLSVAPGELKQLYLFANEESVTSVEGTGTAADGKSLADFFGEYPAGTKGFEDAVDDLAFAPDYSGGKPIAMSSMYRISFPENGNFVDFDRDDNPLYVVRVASKFTVNFLNYRGEQVNVKKFSIEKHADKNFLLAHVNTYPQSGTYNTWIEWLKAVSEASSENDDYATTEAAGWLTDYDMPQGASLDNIYTLPAFTVEAAADNSQDLTSPTPGRYSTSLYIPESKNLINPAEAAGDQEYFLNIVVDQTPEKTFYLALPNLKALFRNTHAIINITMSRNLEIKVEVVPYAEVSLEPDFGIHDDKAHYIPLYDDDDVLIGYYDPRTGLYFDTDRTTVIPNPVPGIDPGTGRKILTNQTGIILYYYDNSNGYYAPDNITRIENPYQLNGIYDTAKDITVVKRSDNGNILWYYKPLAAKFLAPGNKECEIKYDLVYRSKKLTMPDQTTQMVDEINPGIFALSRTEDGSPVYYYNTQNGSYYSSYDKTSATLSGLIEDPFK